MTDGENGALEIHEITFDARDPHALAAFWAALLEREIRPGDMPQDDSVLVVPASGQPGRNSGIRLVVPPAHNRLATDFKSNEPGPNRARDLR